MNLICLEQPTWRIQKHVLVQEKKETLVLSSNPTLVLEVLRKGKKELNVIATENDIQPNLLLGTGKRNSLRKLLWSLTTPGRKT